MDKIVERNTDGVVEHRVLAPADGPRRVERVYPAEVFGDPVLMARVRERLHVLASLDLAGIPRYALDPSPDGRFRLSRPWVEGETLRRLIERRKFSESEALLLLRKVAVILERLHAEGLVHGALTPKSVVVSPEGEVTLLNFRFVDTLPENLSFSEGHFAYMARYAAPETLTGDAGARAADLYAAGCILHELLVGRAPFENDDPVLVAFAHMNEEPALALESDRARALIARLLRKNPAERFADAGQLVRAIDGTSEEAPPAAPEAPAAGRLAASWREVFGGRLAFGRGALLGLATGFLLLLIPLVWFLNLGEYSIAYRIDAEKLFRSRFDALFRPLLAALPEIRGIATAGETATLSASGEMDKLFLEKLDRLFASKLLPRCDLELSGSREVRIRLRPEERIRQLERARLLLIMKLQSRLQQHQVPRFSLTSSPPDRVDLRLPKSVADEALRSLSLKGRLSIHLLLNPAAGEGGGRTGETRLATAPRTGETLLAHAVPPAFSSLALATPAEIKATFALDDRPYALFFNMIGQLNLQDPRPRAASPLPGGAALPSPPPPPAGAKLLVLREDMANETAIFSGRVARAAADRFVYDLSDPVSRPDERPRPFSTLPLVVAVDGEAKAVIANPAGLDPMRAVITGFPSGEALFAFHRLVEAALPDYVEVDFR